MRQLILSCVQAACFLLPLSNVTAETFDLGGMYTYHYHDGRYADWGDFALQGAHIAGEYDRLPLLARECRTDGRNADAERHPGIDWSGL